MLPALARADWFPEDPDPNTKWVQLPDLNGWDVKVTTPKLLADDFECTETSYITDIHFWGSWKHDDVGQITRIHLSIHDNIDPGPVGYSIPGDELWSIDIDPLNYPVDIIDYDYDDQGWYDPNEREELWDDHQVCWQVNVFLEQEDWFLQRGTIEEPRTYWLDIQVDVADPEFTDFGWKTSIDHWQDLAVWADWTPGDPKPEDCDWEELIIWEMPIDMAFVITGVIPEPTIIVVAGFGLVALVGLRRKK